MADITKLPKLPNLSKLPDDGLEELRATLAEQRTAIRVAQNEVQVEIDTRAALNSMPTESRRIVELRLAGSVAPVGEKE